MKVQFKFREEATEDERARVISALDRQGASEVRPLFPDSADEELGALFLAVCESAATGRKLTRTLESSDAVEFAEPEAPRKLIR